MIREAFAADLLRAAACAHGVEHLDAIGVDDAEHGRSGSEDLRPVLMGLQKTKEPGALGQAGKPRPIVAESREMLGVMLPQVSPEPQYPCLDTNA